MAGISAGGDERPDQTRRGGRRNLDLGAALADARDRFAAANPASGARFREACAALPGGNTRTVLFHEPFPLVMERGKGARLWDADGHEYRDFLGEYTAAIFGHSHPVIRAAVAAALDAGVLRGAPCAHEAELATLVCERFPSCERVRFCNSGTEANLMAIALARVATGRPGLLAFHGAYHGGVLNFIDGPSAVNVPFPVQLGTYNDAEGTLATIEAHADELAAIIFEPMLGTGGAVVAEPAFVEALRAAADRHGIVLVADEVMTSRLAAGGLQRELGVHADLTTLGKYIGGGLTFGAFGGRADLMDRFDPRRSDALPHAGTFNNNVLTMAAGVAGMRDVLTPAALGALNVRGERLRDRLNEIARSRDAPACVTGRGSILTVHFRREAPRSPADAAASDPRARALFHLEMAAAGIHVGAKGFVSLCLPLEEGDCDAMAAAFGRFLDGYAAVLE